MQHFSNQFVLILKLSGYGCLICEWDSRSRCEHYVREIWPERQYQNIGENNIVREPLVKKENVTLPSLHLQFGLMKNFIKALDSSALSVKYLQEKFPKVSQAKIKEGVFIGPQIRQIILDEQFSSLLSDLEKRAWQAFRKISQNFLGNKKSPHYENLVLELLDSYKQLKLSLIHI